MRRTYAGHAGPVAGQNGKVLPGGQRHAATLIAAPAAGGEAVLMNTPRKAHGPSRRSVTPAGSTGEANVDVASRGVACQPRSASRRRYFHAPRQTLAEV